LFLTVAVPSGLAAWLAWRRSVWAVPAVLLAGALLVIELLVQIPFLGFNMLQAIFGAVAVGMAVMGLLARRAGWRPRAGQTAAAPGHSTQVFDSGPARVTMKIELVSSCATKSCTYNPV
jgi:hypothetical protein